MKEIVVISGKGGTGKTSITASFAVLAAENAVIADCDVDAADMHLLLEPDFKVKEDFYSGVMAVIDKDSCIQCGQCASVCRFKAVEYENMTHLVNPLSCEGCGYCARICPSGAIEMQEQMVGQSYISTLKTGGRMVHARLGIGAENSGKLVAKVKKVTQQLAVETGKAYAIVDGSPGIGCPVVSSLSGAHFVVLVTEPTVSGVHDLKRVYELVKKFNIPAGCIINKSDLNSGKTAEIHQFLKANGISHISDLPYDESFTQAMTEGKTIVEFDDGRLAQKVHESWQTVTHILDRLEHK